MDLQLIYILTLVHGLTMYYGSVRVYVVGDLPYTNTVMSWL